MEKEIHDYFDDSGKIKKGEADYDKIHREGLPHHTVLFVVVTPGGKIIYHRKPLVEGGVGAGKIDIFGGHIKTGESYIQGAIRELREELLLQHKKEDDLILIGKEGDLKGRWEEGDLINVEFSTLYACFLKPEDKPRFEERGEKGTHTLEVYEKTLKELSEDFKNDKIELAAGDRDKSQFADGLARILEKQEITNYLQFLIEKRTSPEKFMYLCFMTNRDCAEAHRIGTELKKAKKLLIFVAMPFEEQYKQDYLNIKAKFEPLYDVKRADDELKESGYIICGKICAMIQQADFVMVHLTEKWNLNVLYELGLAYALKKKVILLINDETGKSIYPSLFKIQPTLRDLLDKYNFSDQNLNSFSQQFNQKRDYPLSKYSEAVALLYSGTGLKDDLEETLKSLQTQDKEKASDFLNNLHYIDMKNSEEGLTSNIESICKAACVIVEIASDHPESYFWVGFAHGLQKHTLTILNPERPTKNGLAPKIQAVLTGVFEKTNNNLLKEVETALTNLDNVFKTAKDVPSVLTAFLRTAKEAPIEIETVLTNFNDVSKAIKDSLPSEVETALTEFGGVLRDTHAIQTDLRRADKTLKGISEALPFNLRVLYHLEYDPKPNSLFHVALEAILMRIKENLTDPIERFWLPIIKRGKVKIIVGNQNLERPDRVAVGNWDYMAAGALISNLKNRSTNLIVSQTSPISHFSKKEEETIIKDLIAEWGSVDLVVLGSVDVSVGTGIVLEELFKGKRKVIKERKEDFIKALGSPSQNTFSGDTKIIHEACIFSDICQRQKLTNEDNNNDKYRGFYGLSISGSNREVVLGGCNWFNPESKSKEESYDISGSCHLIIADNPFCNNDCPCKNGTLRHKIIVIQGLSGPPTLDITKFLCEKISEETIADSKKSTDDNIKVYRKYILEKAIEAMETERETEGAILEYFIYTNVRKEVKKATPDERKGLGISNEIFQIINNQIFRINEELEQEDWTKKILDAKGKGFIPLSYNSRIPVSIEWISTKWKQISEEDFEEILKQPKCDNLKILMQPPN
ncbi:MAG: NUDIX domain-containing protein [Candidatus Hermodarchaeota archaeon]